MQDRRHSADYDPTAGFSSRHVLDVIASAEQAIDPLRDCPPKHRRAFAILVLFGKPRR